MRCSFRLLPLILLLSLGITTAAAQPSSSEASFATTLQHSESDSSPDAARSSVVLKEKGDSPRKAVGVSTKNLRQYAETDALPNGSSIRTVSLDLSGAPTAPAPQANNGTRTALYVIGGVLVAGGAVAGILALSGGPEPIPAPPGRP